MVTNTVMEARYGLKRRANRQRRLAVTAGAVLLAALLSWIVWAVFFKSPTASGSVSNFQKISNTQVEMTVFIDKPADLTATCQVSAVTDNQSSVGSKQITVRPNGATTLQVKINTVQPAVDGVVELCDVK